MNFTVLIQSYFGPLRYSLQGQWEIGGWPQTHAQAVSIERANARLEDQTQVQGVPTHTPGQRPGPSILPVGCRAGGAHKLRECGAEGGSRAVKFNRGTEGGRVGCSIQSRAVARWKHADELVPPDMGPFKSKLLKWAVFCMQLTLDNHHLTSISTSRAAHQNREWMSSAHTSLASWAGSLQE